MSQNKRYHKKSHLSPRPASKFFFLALGLFCPQFYNFKDPTDDHAPSFFVEFDFFRNRNSSRFIEFFFQMVSGILKCVTSYILDVLDTLHLNWDLGLTSNRDVGHLK